MKTGGCIVRERRPFIMPFRALYCWGWWYPNPNLGAVGSSSDSESALPTSSLPPSIDPIMPPPIPGIILPPPPLLKRFIPSVTRLTSMRTKCICIRVPCNPPRSVPRSSCNRIVSVDSAVESRLSREVIEAAREASELEMCETCCERMGGTMIVDAESAEGDVDRSGEVRPPESLLRWNCCDSSPL